MAAIFQFVRNQIVGKASPMEISIKYTFEGNQGVIRSIVFLQDNVQMVSGSDDGTICKWDCETGQLVGEPWKGEYQVRALALSPDGKTIGCGRIDESVQQWDQGHKWTDDGRRLDGS